ncbi:hypothetical protein D3C73_1392870 [compost metagenome]
MYLADLFDRNQVIDQLRKQIHQPCKHDQAAEKHQAGGEYEAPLFAYQTGEAGQDETQRIGPQLAAMPIKLLVPTQHLLLQ